MAFEFKKRLLAFRRIQLISLAEKLLVDLGTQNCAELRFKAIAEFREPGSRGRSKNIVVRRGLFLGDGGVILQSDGEQAGTVSAAGPAGGPGAAAERSGGGYKTFRYEVEDFGKTGQRAPGADIVPALEFIRGLRCFFDTFLFFLIHNKSHPLRLQDPVIHSDYIN